MRYRVTYKNEGRSESTPFFDTEKEATESADFLKIQGAKRVKILPEWRGEGCQKLLLTNTMKRSAEKRAKD